MCNSSDIVVVENILTKAILTAYPRFMRKELCDILSGTSSISYISCQECDLHFFSPIITGSEKFYSELQLFKDYYPEEKEEFKFAAKYISPNHSVLEIGSGKGAFAKLISPKSYIGLEFSQTAREMARANGVQIINEAVEIHHINYPEAYDVVCSFQVLEHVSNPRKFLEAACACLRPGGRLIISVPSLDSFSSYATNIALDIPPHHVTRWTDIALGNIAVLMNLKLDEIWHEPLQECHKVFYASTVFRNAINKVIRRKSTLIDTSLSGKLIGRLSLFLGKLFSRGLNDNSLLPRGISVTAVYTK